MKITDRLLNERLTNIVTQGVPIVDPLAHGVQIGAALTEFASEHIAIEHQAMAHELVSARMALKMIEVDPHERSASALERMADFLVGGENMEAKHDEATLRRAVVLQRAVDIAIEGFRLLGADDEGARSASTIGLQAREARGYLMTIEELLRAP